MFATKQSIEVQQAELKSLDAERLNKMVGAIQNENDQYIVLPSQSESSNWLFAYAIDAAYKALGGIPLIKYLHLLKNDANLHTLYKEENGKYVEISASVQNGKKVENAQGIVRILLSAFKARAEKILAMKEDTPANKAAKETSLKTLAALFPEAMKALWSLGLSPSFDVYENIILKLNNMIVEKSTTPQKHNNLFIMSDWCTANKLQHTDQAICTHYIKQGSAYITPAKSPQALDQSYSQESKNITALKEISSNLQNVLQIYYFESMMALGKQPTPTILKTSPLEVDIRTILELASTKWSEYQLRELNIRKAEEAQKLEVRKKDEEEDKKTYENSTKARKAQQDICEVIETQIKENDFSILLLQLNVSTILMQQQSELLLNVSTKLAKIKTDLDIESNRKAIYKENIDKCNNILKNKPDDTTALIDLDVNKKALTKTTEEMATLDGQKKDLRAEREAIYTEMSNLKKRYTQLQTEIEKFQNAHTLSSKFDESVNREDLQKAKNFIDQLSKSPKKLTENDEVKKRLDVYLKSINTHEVASYCLARCINLNVTPSKEATFLETYIEHSSKTANSKFHCNIIASIFFCEDLHPSDIMSKVVTNEKYFKWLNKKFLANLHSVPEESMYHSTSS